MTADEMKPGATVTGGLVGAKFRLICPASLGDSMANGNVIRDSNSEPDVCVVHGCRLWWVRREDSDFDSLLCPADCAAIGTE